IVKFSIVYTYKALPTDYGGYLRWANVLRGVDVVGKGLRYPPIYPILLNFFLIPFDQIIALQLCASFLYSIIAIPFFFLASKICKNKMLALIASLLIVFNIFYSEMMGWGGNANILAMSFMTFFLVFWLNILENNYSKRDEILAALFFSLSVGSHYLVTAYLAIFFLVTFSLLVIFRKYILQKEIIRRTLLVGLIGVLFSCPYIISYKYLLQSSALFETGSMLADQRSLENITYLLYKNIINIMFIILGVIGIYIFATKKDKLKGIAIGALFISACIPLFTQHPARWLYFWPTPIFLGTMILLETLITNKQLLQKSSLNKAAVTGITILILAYMLNSIAYLQETSKYYTNITNDALDALKWIKDNTTTDSIIATSGPYRRGGEGTGHNYGWWIEGYSERKCIATCYLRFMIYYDERNFAEKANLIFSGTDILKNDFIMAAETYGDKQGILEMGVNIGDFYENILFLNDSEVIIAYKQDSHFRNMTLTDVGNRNKSANVTVIKIDYLSELLNATKEIMVSDDSSTINLSFRFDYSAQPMLNITSIAIPMFKSDFVDVIQLNMNSDNSTTLDILSPMRASVSTRIQVEYNGIIEIEPNYGPWYEKAQKIITYNISQPQETNVIHFKVIFPKLVNSNHSQTEYYNAYDLIDSLNINYIMINNNRKREYAWFASDTKNFTIVYSNKEITIFSVHLH
ncbi:MAG: hypothetical protein ACTSV7_04065, partial [Candidatus Baldrarchaeia archaeon]